MKIGKGKLFFSQEAIGTIGSYSSFFGFLLIATILAYRQIFDIVFDLAQNKLPGLSIYLVFTTMIVLFALVFVVLPSIPIIKEIAVNFKEKNRRMAWWLILIIFVYDFAIFFQLIYSYLDKFSSILK